MRVGQRGAASQCRQQDHEKAAGAKVAFEEDAAKFKLPDPVSTDAEIDLAFKKSLEDATDEDCSESDSPLASPYVH
jgi:hypothetical protein